MSPPSEIFPTLIASTQRLGRALGAAGAGGAICLGGSGSRGSTGKFIVGFIVMTGAMFVFAACVVLGACVVLIAASRFGQNLVTSHQSTPRAVKPAPENIHCLFCTIHSHIVRLPPSAPLTI